MPNVVQHPQPRLSLLRILRCPYLSYDKSDARRPHSAVVLVEGHLYYVFVAPGRALPRPIVYLVIPPTGHLFLQITLSIAFFKKLILIPQSPSCLLFIDLTVIPALSLRQFLPRSGKIQEKAATNSLLPHSRP